MTTINTRNTSSSSRANVNATNSTRKQKWEAAPSTRQTPAQKQNPQQNPSRSGSINTPGYKTGTTINPNTKGSFGGGSAGTTGTGTTGGRR